ncbi:MAG: Flagellar biosynthesis protein FlhF [Desulfovibrio sp.]
MHVKTYTGSSTSQVLARIKADLGPDAVILDTRETTRNGAAEISITAALEREAPSISPGISPGISSPAMPHYVAGIPGGNGRDTAPMGWKNWQEEWGVIKTHLLAMMKPELKLDKLTPRQRTALDFLEQAGVADTPLLSVYEALMNDPEASVLAPLAFLTPVKAWGKANWPQKVHLVSGPFGAGKTTVLVRLALLLKKEAPRRKIWVVNADARRGGGRLLLKNYAQLCDFEYREIANAVEFAQVLASGRSENVETILVDLPGLPRGKTMPEMLDYFGMTDPAHALHLVLSPNGSEKEMQTLVTRYAPCDLANERSLIWTKLDEAENFGALINVGAACRTPVCALSCGAELNGTLAPAKDTALWRLLFKREMPCPASPAAAGF